MRVLDPGHRYLLDSLDGGAPWELRFVKREGAGFPGNVGSHSGTNLQEVLRACIERAEYLNGQIACGETESVVGLLRAAVMLLELRAAQRHGRYLHTAGTDDVVSGKVCERCGHVGCGGHEKSERIL